MVLVAALATSPIAALAHAVVMSSQPAPNAVVGPGELRIRLQFSSRIDSARSRLTLLGPDGRSATIPATAGGAAGELLAQTRVAARGRWKLEWQVLSLDGHVTRGEIPFEVGGGIPVP